MKRYLFAGKILVGSIITILFLTSGCMTFRTPDKKVHRYFDKHDTEVQIHHSDWEGRSVRYLQTGAPSDSCSSWRRQVISFRGRILRW